MPREMRYYLRKIEAELAVRRRNMNPTHLRLCAVISTIAFAALTVVSFVTPVSTVVFNTRVGIRMGQVGIGSPAPRPLAVWEMLTPLNAKWLVHYSWRIVTIPSGIGSFVSIPFWPMILISFAVLAFSARSKPPFLACSSCGYSLVGLQITEIGIQCPECGKPSDRI